MRDSTDPCRSDGDSKAERPTWSREFLELAGSAPDFPDPEEPPPAEPEPLFDD